MMEDDEDSMYYHMMGAVNKLLEDGIDLKATPALYRWRYPSKPEYEFHLLIKELSPQEQEWADIPTPDHTIN